MEALTRLYSVADRSRREGGAFALPRGAIDRLYELATPRSVEAIQAAGAILSFGVGELNHPIGAPARESAEGDTGLVMLSLAVCDVARAYAHARAQGIPLPLLDPHQIAKATGIARSVAFTDAWNICAIAGAQERGRRAE